MNAARSPRRLRSPDPEVDASVSESYHQPAIMAFSYIWEYRVREEDQAVFEAGYGPEGEWAELFRRGAGYLRTELLRDRADPTRYVTIDYWESEKAFLAFRRELASDFEEIDRRFERVTAEEAKLGEFDVI